MELTAQRGAIAIDLDRPRILLYDHEATWLLIEKYGDGFLPELFALTGKIGDPISGREVKLKSMDALAYFLWAGLQAEAKVRGEEFTLEDAYAQLAPYTYRRILMDVMKALDRNIKAPTPPGKPEAAAARPAAAAKSKARLNTGPTKVSTSSKRSAGRSA